MKKNIYIFTGGTLSPIAPHFDMCSFAKGEVGWKLFSAFRGRKAHDYNVYIIETAMACRELDPPTASHFEEIGLDPTKKIKTNDDVKEIVDRLCELDETRGIVMSCALCDYVPIELRASAQWSDCSFDADIIHDFRDSGVIKERIHKAQDISLRLKPAEKIINRIRKTRKDIFLVSFKATTDMTPQETYRRALDNLKGSSSNLVLANDIINHTNMIVTPEEFPYQTNSRDDAIDFLAKMTLARMSCHFTRSTVIKSDLIPWDSQGVYPNLRSVVDHCIEGGAYKTFRGATVGHFAMKSQGEAIYTSVRKSNFNEIKDTGLVKIESDGPDKVIAYGAKPSVGGQSQRIIFKQHTEKDCIVHFHCPLKDNHPTVIPIRTQWQNECGSHECGQNTSDGLEEVVPGIKAVMLANHGPNIVFSSSLNPQKVIDFIDANWDLSKKTGGSVALVG